MRFIINLTLSLIFFHQQYRLIPYVAATYVLSRYSVVLYEKLIQVIMGRVQEMDSDLLVRTGIDTTLHNVHNYVTLG